MRARRDELTPDQQKAVEEALPELRDLARRLLRRCPHKTLDELARMAEDALMRRVRRWDPKRSRLIDFAREYVQKDVLRAAHVRPGDVAADKIFGAMDEHEEGVERLDTASRWAETLDAKVARAIALGQDEALVGLYAYSGARAAQSPEDDYSSREWFEEMRRVTAEVDPRAPVLFRLLYEQGLIWEEASAQLGLDKRQAQRIEARALARLREVLRVQPVI